MPELPEVENLRRGLEKNILGQKIQKVIVNKPKLVSGHGAVRTASRKKGQEFISGLLGEKFIAVERRAKNLIFRLSNQKILLVHLKMTGQFVYLPSHKATARQGNPKKGQSKIVGGHPIEISETKIPNKHTHIIFELSKGILYYNDIRMFGYVLYYPSIKDIENKNHFKKLGLEPFDNQFTLEYFSNALKKRKGKIKVVLMDQSIVTGLGNIYADESLFESGINPKRSASSLKKIEIEKLYKNIIKILKTATRVGGSSVATYRLLDNSRGNYARSHKVYGKVGNPCSICKTKIKKIIIGSRSTAFCPKCQK